MLIAAGEYSAAHRNPIYPWRKAQSAPWPTAQRALFQWQPPTWSPPLHCLKYTAFYRPSRSDLLRLTGSSAKLPKGAKPAHPPWFPSGLRWRCPANRPAGYTRCHCMAAIQRCPSSRRRHNRRHRFVARLPPLYRNECALYESRGIWNWKFFCSSILGTGFRPLRGLHPGLCCSAPSALACVSEGTATRRRDLSRRQASG